MEVRFHLILEFNMDLYDRKFETNKAEKNTSKSTKDDNLFF